MSNPSVTPDSKIYIVNFVAANTNLYALHRYLLDSADILGFWNYIPLVYCIKSRLTAKELAQKITAFFPTGGFMVAELNPYNIDGRLTLDAWSWFYAPPRVNWGGILPAESSPYPLGDLLNLPGPKTK